MHFRAQVTLTLFVVLTATASLAAGAPDPSCRSGKLSVGGKYGAALLACQSKAASTASAVDAGCVAKAAAKFTDGFAAAETKAGVTCNGLLATTTPIFDDLVDAAALAVPVPGGGGLCASLGLKATGKFAGAFLGAWSKFAKGGDDAARDASIAKARATLQKSITKAETKAGCTAAGQYEAARAAVENTLDAITACIGSSTTCVETHSEATVGETVTTDPTATGPTAAVPLTSSVETPNAGTVVLRVTDSTTDAPSGYEVLGREVEVTAPDASTAAPLILTFVIDASLLPADPNTVELTRNGVVVADCTGAPGVASPDPCLQSRTLLGSGDLELVALSSHASLWFPVVTAAAPPCPTSMVWKVRADTASTDRSTEMDLGWAGGLHNVDPVDGGLVAFDLSCAAPSQPLCGVCDITGFDPDHNTCRCANNTRTSCDQPNVADADDCGGAVCQCYTAPPTPVDAFGTPICMVRKATANPTGTWDPLAGAGSVNISDASVVYLGNSVFDPCPVCTGDATANDGVQGGVCSGGGSNGLACDASGTDPTFPPGGGSVSYDCMPAPANNISGVGIRITRTETTGAVSLASGIPCVAGSGSCPCAVCSGNTSVACSSDAECAAVAAGTCTSQGSGVSVRQNQCSGACVAGAGGEGTCPLDDVLRYCDGFVEEDGRGVVACGTNDDCDAVGASAGVDAGDCNLFQERPCFLSPIQASGSPSSAQPHTASAFCIAPISNSAANSVTGLPGPGRMRTEWEVTYLQ